ncbi:MAG: hypothetical protein WD529_07220 [Balneolaceae bacterium]
MNKLLSTIARSLPVIISLFRAKTSQEGKGIVKSGVASLTISGLISSGRMAAGEIDSTLLIILAILETGGYLFGVTALSAGASQTCPEEALLEGRGDGLSAVEAKVMGREWVRMKQQKQMKEIGYSSISKPEARDLSEFLPTNQKPNKE